MLALTSSVFFNATPGKDTVVIGLYVVQYDDIIYVNFWFSFIPG